MVIDGQHVMELVQRKKMRKKQIILPKLRYENAPEIDTQIRVGFEEEKSILRNDDRNIVLNLSEQFTTERSECKRYKLYGKMKIVFRNLYLGVSYYDYLKERLALYGDGSDGCFAGYLPYDEFAFLRRDLYYETTSGVSVSNMSEFTGFTIITSGTTQHQNITALTAPYHNWNIYLTYVYDHDTSYPIKYTLSGNTIAPLSFVSGDGIPFRVQETISKYILTSPVKHGISQGEYIIINSRNYYVNSVGNENYNSENYVINILKSQLSGVTFNSLITGKRCTNINDISNSTSQYYVHQHKTLTTIGDYILDKVGFESPIWEDERKLLYENFAGIPDYIVEQNRMESVLFDFKEPFTLTGITNNLGYTPTELYVSIIFRNGNGFFNYPPKIGYKFNFHDTWVDEHFDGETSKEISITGQTFTVPPSAIVFTSGETINKGTILHGAFVEYNSKEMKERIISESFHKIVNNSNIFNHGQELSETYYGSSVTNPIGIYYQPHYRFKIRELSPYVEISDAEAVIDNLPENARYFPNEKVWRWRDLYDDGYVDTDGYGTDYPYLNDIHYIHKDINFYLRNEQIYTNKVDGLINFYKRGDEKICMEEIIQVTPSVTPSITPSIMASPSITPTVTPSVTLSATPTVMPTVTPTITPSKTPTVTPSITASPSKTPTVTPSKTPAVTPTKTPTVTPSITVSTSRTPAVTLSISVSPTVIPTVTPTITPSITVSLSITPTMTPTVSPSITPCVRPSLPYNREIYYGVGGPYYLTWLNDLSQACAMMEFWPEGQVPGNIFATNIETSGYTFDIGMKIYSGWTSTGCEVVITGYYIVSEGNPFPIIIHVNDNGVVDQHPVCPSPTPTITPTPTPTHP